MTTRKRILLATWMCLEENPAIVKHPKNNLISGIRISLYSYRIIFPDLLSHLEVWVCAKFLHLCLTLCDPMDCSLPGSSVHRILQGRILEWVAMSSSRGSSWPRDWTHISCISCTAGGFFATSTTWEAHLELKKEELLGIVLGKSGRREREGSKEDKKGWCWQGSGLSNETWEGLCYLSGVWWQETSLCLSFLIYKMG